MRGVCFSCLPFLMSDFAFLSSPTSFPNSVWVTFYLTYPMRDDAEKCTSSRSYDVDARITTATSVLVRSTNPLIARPAAIVGIPGHSLRLLLAKFRFLRCGHSRTRSFRPSSQSRYLVHTLAHSGIAYTFPPHMPACRSQKTQCDTAGIINIGRPLTFLS